MTSEYPSFSPPPPPPQSLPEGMAIAALVLGILGLIIPLAGIPLAIIAIILGIVALTQVSSGRAAGQGKAIAGIVTGGLGVLCAPLAISILLPALSLAREQAKRAVCQSNLHQIGAAIAMYSNHENNGALPDTVGHLIASQPISTSLFICPDDKANTIALGSTRAEQAASIESGGHDSYIYVGRGVYKLTAAGDVVVMYEPIDIHRQGMNVLFGDGQVRFLKTADANLILAQARKAQSPIYWPPHQPTLSPQP